MDPELLLRLTRYAEDDGAGAGGAPPAVGEPPAPDEIPDEPPAEPPGDEPPPDPEAEARRWEGALRKEQQGHEKLKDLKGPADLFDAYLEASERAEHVPAAPPESPDGYELPEGVEREQFGGLLAAAHESGLNQDQFTRLVAAAIKTRGEAFETATTELKTELGEDYDPTVRRAVRAAQHFGAFDALKKLGLDNNADMVRAWSKVFRAIDGDKLIDGSIGGKKKTYDKLEDNYTDMDEEGM